MISATVSYSGITPDIAAKELNTIKRQAYLQLAEHFWRVNVPRRFTWSGGRMLGYAPRSPKYERAKFKKYGHNDPLVASGRSRDIATSIMDISATATAKTTNAKIKLHARALNFKNPNSQIHPAEEVRRIAEKEVPPLVRKLEGYLQQEFKQFESHKSKERV
jgi:hypothetical protein